MITIIFIILQYPSETKNVIIKNKYLQYSTAAKKFKQHLLQHYKCMIFRYFIIKQKSNVTQVHKY